MQMQEHMRILTACCNLPKLFNLCELESLLCSILLLAADGIFSSTFSVRYSRHRVFCLTCIAKRAHYVPRRTQSVPGHICKGSAVTIVQPHSVLRKSYHKIPSNPIDKKLSTFQKSPWTCLLMGAIISLTMLPTLVLIPFLQNTG